MIFSSIDRFREFMIKIIRETFPLYGNITTHRTKPVLLREPRYRSCVVSFVSVSDLYQEFITSSRKCYRRELAAILPT
jgi:hypothetical protein